MTGMAPDLNDLAGNDLPADRAQFDFDLGLRSGDLTADEIDLLRPRADEVNAARAQAGRWRKTHDALFPGPAGEPVLSVAATIAALYVIRDPRDVAISFAAHSGRSLTWAVDRMASPDAAFARTRNGRDLQLRQRLGTWSEHVRSWVDQTWFPVSVIRYEDCLMDPVATFTLALRAGGLNVTLDAVTAAIELASLRTLRAQETTAGFSERPATMAGSFFERAAAGGWIDGLPGPLAARIETEHGDVMRRFGYLD